MLRCGLQGLDLVHERAVEYLKKGEELAAAQVEAAEGAADHGGEAQSSAPAAKARKKSKVKFIDDVVDLTLPVAKQFGIMVRSALQHFWQSIATGDTIKDGMIIGVAEQTEEVWEAWVKLFSDRAKTIDTCQIETALCSIKVVAQCVRENEKDKPPTSDVRAARKFIHANSVGKGSDEIGQVAQDLCKLMIGYKPSIYIMEVARRHASRGFEDDAASKIFESGCANFETNFETAYADMELFINEPDKSDDVHATMTYSILLKRLLPINDLLVAIMNSALRWSVAAMNDNLDSVTSAIANALELVSCGVYGVMPTFHKLVCRPLSRALADRAAMDSAGGVDCDGGAGRDGSAGLSLGDQPQPARGSENADSEQGLELDAVRPDRTDPVMLVLGGLRTVKQSGTDYHAGLQQLLQGISKCIDALTQRRGDPEFAEMIASLGSVTEVAAALNGNWKMVQDMVDYMQACVEISAVLTKSDGAELFGPTKFDASLRDYAITMARLQHELAGITEIVFMGTSSVDDAAVLNDISVTFFGFKAQVADAVYDQIASIWISPTVMSMLGFSELEVAVVQDDVLESTDRARVLGRLIRKPGVNDALPGDIEAMLKLEEADSDQFDELVHHRTLSALKEFAAATNMSVIQAAGVVMRDGEQGNDRAVPFEVAAFVFDLMTAVRDLVMMAIALQRHLVNMDGEVAKEVELAKAQYHPVSNIHVNALSLMYDRLKLIDTFVTSEAARKMELDGFSMRIPVHCLGKWATQVATFTRRCRDDIMELRMAGLAKSVLECRADLPLWQPIFTDNSFNLAMAVDLLDGKLANVVRSYNALFGVLSKVDTASKRVELSPPLQHNPLTMSGVAVASQTLANLYEASVLIQGVNLLRFQSRGPASSKAAREFNAKHKADKKINLPNAFWAELACVEDGASAPMEPLRSPTALKLEAQSLTKIRGTASASGASAASSSASATTAAPRQGAAGISPSVSAGPPSVSESAAADAGPPAKKAKLARLSIGRRSS
ncbi:unnamed protein product [Prorocentrum cordatum]|uniref:Exocyst complex component Sec6 n=1 Tax=Prorocentrum cordatum TaxID=2364126 RepID=A0ABN9PXD0_9DINO|nr:unnamed protein product [Polarella glacialis]